MAEQEYEPTEDADVESILEGVGVSSGTISEPRVAVSDEKLTAALAASLVRRWTNQHGCSPSEGPCEHPNHPRDIDYLGHMLEALDLPRTPPNLTREDKQRYLKGATKRGSSR